VNEATLDFAPCSMLKSLLFLVGSVWRGGYSGGKRSRSCIRCDLLWLVTLDQPTTSI
jgi:hypothetical protein